MASQASTASRSVEADAGASARSAKPAGEVIAITVRDDFLLDLGESLGGQAAVHPVDSFAAALERLSGTRRAQLLAIDSRDVADLRGDAERAHAQVPQVPVVVFAPTESEKTVASALKSSNVFAVLPIPVDRRKTAAIFEGALADAQAKRAGGRGVAERARDGETRAPEALGPSAADRGGEIRFEARPPLSPAPMSVAAQPVHAAAEPPSGHKAAVWAIAGIAAAALAGGGYWLFAPSHPHAPASSAAAQQAGSAASRAAGANTAAAPVSEPQVALVQGTLDSLLEKARLAMRERRYTEPASNCALLYYRSALGVDPTNGEARDGMARLATLLKSRFDESLAGGKLDEAAGALASLKVAAPGDARLGALESRLLEAEIGKELSDGNVDRATALIHQAQQSGAVPAGELAKWRAEIAKYQDVSRTKHLADLFAERIRDGRLIEPANDNAEYYLQQLKQIAPGNPVAQRGPRDLVAAMLRKAREAAVAGQTSEASSWVAEARSAGMTSGDYAAYQRDVSAAKQRAAAAETDRLVQLARERLQDGRLTDPANDSAAYYLTQLKSARPGDPAVGSVSRELATRLIERATASAHAGRGAEMRADLALARQWGADPTLLQAVEDILGGRPSAPAPAARSAVGSAIPPGFVPKRTRYVAPEYPERALDAHISGSVTVEFTIDTNGRPTDVRVVDSTPADMFDSAAIQAVRAWRYQPAVFNGVKTQIPTRMVIRFQAPSN